MVADPSRTAMALHLLETCRMTTCRIDYVHEGTGDPHNAATWPLLTGVSTFVSTLRRAARAGPAVKAPPVATRVVKRVWVPSLYSFRHFFLFLILFFPLSSFPLGGPKMGNPVLRR